MSKSLSNIFKDIEKEKDENFIKELNMTLEILAKKYQRTVTPTMQVVRLKQNVVNNPPANTANPVN